MEDKVGLLRGYECKFSKTNDDLILQLADKTTLNKEIVREMMRYNVFTINQFSFLARLSVSHVLNKTRPSVIDGAISTELDYCYPFSDPDGTGPKFIVRNSKSEKYLKA